MFEDIHPTKLSILKAAVEVFGQKGFNGATTKEIARIGKVLNIPKNDYYTIFIEPLT